MGGGIPEFLPTRTAEAAGRASLDAVELKGDYRTKDPRLDRIPFLDERSLDFPARAVLRRVVKRQSRLWPVRWALDQRNEGACTNFALAHNRIGRPKPRRVAATVPDAEALARKLYRRSQQLDEWPGEEPTYSGTSALAACKAWQEAKLLDEYRWCFGIDDVIDTLASYGPVCFATEWTPEMFEPGRYGLLEVGDSVAGGHMYAMIGVVLQPQRSSTWRPTGEREPLLLGWQSWGATWGPKGALFAMRATDAERLLKGIESPGECVVPVDRG